MESFRSAFQGGIIRLSDVLGQRVHVEKLRKAPAPLQAFVGVVVMTG